jgi:hypothetical protein
VASWVSTRGRRDNFLLLRYEDMLQDTRCELARVAAFLALAPTTEKFERTIASSSAEHLRQMEKQQENQWAATRKHRKDIPFVGKAKSGGWQTDLPASSIRQIETAWGELMTSLGYSLVSARVPEGKLGLVSPLSR